MHIARLSQDAFKQAAIHQFIDEMVEHLSQWGRPYSISMGVPALRNIATTGLQRSNMHGFRDAISAKLFIELAMLFGSEFDVDPLLPWASHSLNSMKYLSEHELAFELFRRSTDYLTDVFGPSGIYARNAIELGMGYQLDDFPDDNESFVEKMLDLLGMIYPQRLAIAGKDAAISFVEQCRISISSWSACVPKSAAVVTCLSFTLGYGALRDPRFPKIRQILDSTNMEPSLRTTTLFSFLQNYLHSQYRIFTVNSMSNIGG